MMVHQQVEKPISPMQGIILVMLICGKKITRCAVTFFEPFAKSPALNSDAFTQDAYIRTADSYFMLKNYDKAKTMYDNVIKLSWPAEDYATFQNAMLAGVKSPKDKITLMNTMMRKFPNFIIGDGCQYGNCQYLYG